MLRLIIKTYWGREGERERGRSTHMYTCALYGHTQPQAYGQLLKECWSHNHIHACTVILNEQQQNQTRATHSTLYTNLTSWRVLSWSSKLSCGQKPKLMRTPRWYNNAWTCPRWITATHNSDGWRGNNNWRCRFLWNALCNHYAQNTSKSLSGEALKVSVHWQSDGLLCMHKESSNSAYEKGGSSYEATTRATALDWSNHKNTPAHIITIAQCPVVPHMPGS